MTDIPSLVIKARSGDVHSSSDLNALLADEECANMRTEVAEGICALAAGLAQGRWSNASIQHSSRVTRQAKCRLAEMDRSRPAGSVVASIPAPSA